MVALVRGFQAGGLMSRASSILNSSPVCELDQAAAQTVLPGIPSHTPHLVRLVRTFLHKVRENADEHQGGTAARKGQGVQST
jgi:hypothetical protein